VNYILSNFFILLNSGDFVSFKRNVWKHKHPTEDKGSARDKFTNATFLSLDEGKTMGGQDYKQQSNPSARVIHRRLTVAAGSSRRKNKSLTDQYFLDKWSSRWFARDELSLRISGRKPKKNETPPTPIAHVTPRKWK
jgi:hypothetical protein